MDTRSKRQTAASKIEELAEKRGLNTRKDLRNRIYEKTGIEINRQTFDWWMSNQKSFPNDIAEILTESLDLNGPEQIELALALTHGQSTRRLRGQDTT